MNWMRRFHSVSTHCGPRVCVCMCVHLPCILACTYSASLPSKQFRECLINSYCSLLCDTIWYDDLKMLLGQGEFANCDTTDFKNDLIERPLSWHWGRLRANSRLANIFSESTWKCNSFAVCRKIKGCQLSMSHIWKNRLIITEMDREQPEHAQWAKIRRMG